MMGAIVRNPVKLPISLPSGWTAEREREDDDGVIFIKMPSPDFGIVTVDLHARAFAFGMTYVRRDLEGKYAGRGWQKALFLDAVAGLQKVYE